MQNKGFITVLTIAGITALILIFGGSYLYTNKQSYQFNEEFGSPASRLERNILPVADGTYDLGSTTPASEWKNVYAKNITVSETLTATVTPSTVAIGLSITGGSAGSVLYQNEDDSSLAATTTTNLKSSLSLDLVENTALSTWGGSTNLVTLGTITTGVWNGTALTDDFVSNDLTSGDLATTTSVVSDTEVDNDITIDSSTVVTAPNFSGDTTATSTFTGGLDADSVDSNKGYSIADTTVLTLSSLGSSVISSSLTGVGTLTVGSTGSGFTIDLDNSSLTCTACLSAGVYGSASIDGDDINSNIAGRSLTLTSGSPDTLDADVELYTYNIGANLFATTTANGIATTTEDFLSIPIANASTITGFRCYTDQSGTSTIQASISTDGASAGSAVFYNDYAGFNGIECGSSQENATTTFQNSAISADDWLHIWVTDAGPYSTPPEVIYVSFTATKND